MLLGSEEVEINPEHEITSQMIRAKQGNKESEAKLSIASSSSFTYGRVDSSNAEGHTETYEDVWEKLADDDQTESMGASNLDYVEGTDIYLKEEEQPTRSSVKKKIQRFEQNQNQPTDKPNHQNPNIDYAKGPKNGKRPSMPISEPLNEQDLPLKPVQFIDHQETDFQCS